jgi:hypothetical protein
MHMVRASKESESGAPPDPRMMEAIGRLAGELMQSGRMIEMGGLLPSSMGARVRASGGKISVTDGPFAEVKELIGGYAIIEASSREQAIEDARRFLQVHIDVMGAEYEGECEVRQLFQ